MIFRLNNVLLGDNHREGAQGLSIQGDKLIQSEPILEAASQPQYDRGNHTRLITFTVTREFADYDRAESGAVDLLEQFMDLSGTLEMTCKGASGRTSKRQCPNCEVLQVVVRQLGVSIDFVFRIRGDRITIVT